MIALPPPKPLPAALLLDDILGRFGGAVEYWTVSCMSRGEYGDPEPYIAHQWAELADAVQDLRSELSAQSNETDLPWSVQEQVGKLVQSVGELREVFDLLIDFQRLTTGRLELTLLRLGSLWRNALRRVTLLGAILPLPAPLPGLSAEQESGYQDILDRLYDRFEAARQPERQYA